MDVRLPDGTVVKNVPDGMSKADLAAKLSASGYDVAKLNVAPQETIPDSVNAGKSMGSQVWQNIGNLVGGAVRGAGSIGSTILAPYDMAKDALAGKGLSLQSNDQRRAAIDAGLQTMGVQPESGAYKAAKLTTEIAGTSGVGGLLSNGARAIGAAPAVVDALASGGFNLGRPASATISGKAADLALRTGTGAILGGASSGLVDPSQAKTGALIGGALPGGALVAGKIGGLIRTGAKNALGAATGTSAEAVGGAFGSGKAGATEFLDNMRGKANFDDVVDSAKAGLQKMRADRGADYRSGMLDISNDKSVLDFSPIDKAVKQVQSIGSYKGVQTNKHASGIVDELAAKVDEWKSLDPTEFHTPEGLDALKQAIGDIRDSTQFGTSSRKAADSVYNAVKNEISKQAPTYSNVMKGYSEASGKLKEIEKALSLGDKASKDTAMRKLQSLTRNNAQTNYGNRLSLANQLEQEGGVSLTPAISGQAMSSWAPRGMTGAISKAGGAALAGASVVNPALLPYLATMPLTSPRLIGELAYKAGRATGAVSKGAQGLLGNSTAETKRLLGLLNTAPSVTLSSP